jgi:hypothetical protein
VIDYYYIPEKGLIVSGIVHSDKINEKDILYLHSNNDISEIKIESNIAQKTTHGPSGTPIKIILNFLSDEFVNRNFDTGIDDFIGKISKKGPGDDGTIAVAREDMVLDPYNKSIIIPNELKNKEKGLVQFVMKQASAKSKKPLAAHETFNDIWFKTSFTFYPYQKDANSLRITHLMNYVCEYACYKGNENAANFFFWEDLDQWNFKCIEGLIEEQKQAIENFTLPTKEGETSTLPVFKPHLDELSENAMLSIAGKAKKQTINSQVQKTRDKMRQ